VDIEGGKQSNTEKTLERTPSKFGKEECGEKITPEGFKAVGGRKFASNKKRWAGRREADRV